MTNTKLKNKLQSVLRTSFFSVIHDKMVEVPEPLTGEKDK